MPKWLSLFLCEGYQPNLTEIIQSRHLFKFGHIVMNDDIDAKMILTSPPPGNWKRLYQDVLVSRGWTPSSAIWEPTTSHWTKQSTWLTTALCGGWCLRMTLRTPSGACQKRRGYHGGWLLCIPDPPTKGKPPPDLGCYKLLADCYFLWF